MVRKACHHFPIPNLLYSFFKFNKQELGYTHSTQCNEIQVPFSFFKNGEGVRVIMAVLPYS